MFEYRFLPEDNCMIERIQICDESISFYINPRLDENPVLELNSLFTSCSPLRRILDDDVKHTALPEHNADALHYHLWFPNGVSLRKFVLCWDKIIDFQEKHTRKNRGWGWTTTPMDYLPMRCRENIFAAYENYLLLKDNPLNNIYPYLSNTPADPITDLTVATPSIVPETVIPNVTTTTLPTAERGAKRVALTLFSPKPLPLEDSISEIFNVSNETIAVQRSTV